MILHPLGLGGEPTVRFIKPLKIRVAQTNANQSRVNRRYVALVHSGRFAFCL